MEANIPRPWQRLPRSQKKVIEDYARKVAEEQTERDARLILDLYMKMVCITLHDAFGFGEKRLNVFLGNHRRLFYRQRKLVQNNEQIEYLDRRMAEIFKKDGFPQEFFDEMLGSIESDDTKGEEGHEIFQANT